MTVVMYAPDTHPLKTQFFLGFFVVELRHLCFSFTATDCKPISYLETFSVYPYWYFVLFSITALVFCNLFRLSFFKNTIFCGRYLLFWYFYVLYCFTGFVSSILEANFILTLKIANCISTKKNKNNMNCFPFGLWWGPCCSSF
jgi:hypothetical protein